MPINLPPASLEPALRRTCELTGRQVLLSFIAFFLVVGAVNATMMTLAIRSMPGTRVKSAYEASQRYNHDLEVIAAQDRLGWRIDIAAAGLGAGAPLEIEARDKDGAPLAGLDVRIRIERPADARFDQRVQLTPRGGGRYAAPVPALASGQWLLAVEIYRDGARAFVSERRIVIRDGAPVRSGG
jgi:nitrogen fixation protein FixH